MVQHAISTLSRRVEGFVLVVEGSQIDWACHDNDFETLQAELLDFEGAVTEGFRFAQQDGATVVVVTADHETGGLALIGDEPDASDVEGRWISDGHTACMVPVLAYGPGSHRLGGLHRNTEIGRILFSLLGRSAF
jgi:alkaline phosphatase